MISLRDWWIQKGFAEGEDRYIAHGIVSGHPKLRDGINITTSVIEEMKFDETNNRVIFLTHSKNEYFIELSTICFNCFEETASYLNEWNITIPSKEECIKLAEEFKKKELKELSGVLKDNELYLKISGAYVQKAFWKKGEIREINISAHIGMFQDSYLITDWEKGEVDFRYFDGWLSMRPYHYSDGLETILVDNIGSSDVTFDAGAESITCKAGELTRIEKKHFTAEGLFSPDVVNGKGLYKEWSDSFGEDSDKTED